jgi:hypothetical protein
MGTVIAAIVSTHSGPSAADQWPAIAIPAQNALALTRASARPPDGDVAVRASHVAAALSVGGSNDAALDFFLPLDPFLAIKDMNGARGYHSQLIRMYRQDLDAYRAQFAPGATIEFLRFERSSACTWMSIGREANRLPYWSCYGSRLIVRVAQREVSLRVHVLINWGDRWYVTHLGRIRHRAASPPAGAAAAVAR